MEEKNNYCGIDVSSETLDIYFKNKEGILQHLQVTNTVSGFRKIIKLSGKSTHFVMEATGVYHLHFIFFLKEQNMAFSVVNALQIKRYIQMHLERNKSDKKDAKRIYEYGVDRQPEIYAMPDTAYFEYRSLNNAIHDLTKEITKFSNQIHSIKKCPFETKTIEKSFEKIIKKLKEEKQNLEMILQQKLMAWESEMLKLVTSVKGIGSRAGAELIIYTQGFKDMDSYKQLISYAGLSPTEYRSGSSIRGRVRICKQGGKQLRHILYMCALNAKKTNAQCKALFDRLVEKGKNKKAAIIAVCNKLLKIVFGVVKNKTMYQDNFIAKSA
ncbi:IS110 family RNA-guided transposase [Chryseobacterium turcicum]|uniref:IS110 family transposase n=1 Tax=Chryseobacterium turcicum TaxID=2898076 RepID=A0A9Q3V264_9FLAO|nr:IS110 family transposase [Chryseobacterium turcicum]MCD1116962.1 IS110 family transposase [Chryseobacterium turcicum]